MKSTTLIFCLFTIVNLGLFAQTDNVGKQVIVTLLDKSEIKGELVSENDTEVVITSTTLGLLTFQQTEIKRIIYLDAKGRIPNPNPTKYFLGQSAYTLDKEEGYYQNIYGIFNLVSYGITDRFSASAGVELISTFSGSPIIFTNLKYGIPVSKRLNLAASFTYVSATGDLSGEFNLGTLNALATYGTKEYNITVGTGYAFANGEVTDSPITTIAGVARLTNKLAFISENYILDSNNGSVTSFGLRYIAKKLTLDLLVFSGGVPALDIVLKF